MKCPTDGATLVMADRQGVEIDYCPDCRGVWLDRGELDKIIARAADSPAAAAPARPSTPPPPRAPERYRDDYDDDRPYDRRRKKKRSSFLEEMFDFG
jgi:Zn-finger nucleic acid-binding protein